MRKISPELAASLAGGATTLARCWKLTRRDGLVMGFTDHDRDLAFDGVTYAAESGVEGSELEQHFSFAVGGGEISGALASDGLTESDLAKGLWDDAAIEITILDWSSPQARMLADKGAVGEVRRHGAAYVAEMRGEAHRLDQERGRVYAAPCSASLGDARCGVDRTQPQWRASAIVDWTDGRALVSANALQTFEAGLFRGGSLLWTQGANAGFAQDVSDHRPGAEGAMIALWLKPPQPIAPGDFFTISAGCDKRFATCRDRFANAANFRGFPHMPGNDALLRVAREGEPNMDGGSLFR